MASLSIRGFLGFGLVLIGCTHTESALYSFRYFHVEEEIGTSGIEILYSLHDRDIIECALECLSNLNCGDFRFIPAHGNVTQRSCDLFDGHLGTELPNTGKIYIGGKLARMLMGQ